MAVWEQERKEFQWLISNIVKAERDENEPDLEKWTKKLDNWRTAHSYAFDQLQKAFEETVETGEMAQVEVKIRPSKKEVDERYNKKLKKYNPINKHRKSR